MVRSPGQNWSMIAETARCGILGIKPERGHVGRRMLMPSAADLTTTGPLIAFASVLAGSPGIPVPSFAAIIFVGSLLATRHGSVGTGAFVFAAAMAGAVLGDVARFFAGRRHDGSVLGLVCRLPLSRDSCVRRTADAFSRRGRQGPAVRPGPARAVRDQRAPGRHLRRELGPVRHLCGNRHRNLDREITDTAAMSASER